MVKKINWNEFLKDLPTEVLLSEIEMRKSKRLVSLSEESVKIMNDIDEAIQQFGEYTFSDKGPGEVMDIYDIKDYLSEKPIEEIASILSEILDNYEDVDKSLRVVSCIIGEFDSLPEEEFDRLLNSDERFEY